ncbi:hypothetical protein ACFLS8_02570 [Chloroflexota bacterium]
MATVIKDTNFNRINKDVKPDPQRRVTLPSDLVVEGVTFRIYHNRIGQIILDPQVTIPASEAWVFQNPEILSLAKQGLAAAAEGRVSKIDLDNL